MTNEFSRYVDFEGDLFPVIPVRCCCTPKKLLGYVTLKTNGEALHPGRRYRWALHRLISVRPDRAAAVFAPSSIADEIDLELAEFGHGTIGRTELAFKSNDHPIEKLRQLPGWRDA